MHGNPAYRGVARERNIDFARERGFGVLTVAGPDGPLASHIPFVLSEDGAHCEAHILRSNPIWQAIETPQPALVAVSGPDGYVSPDWYGVEDQVPTWNYVAVHLRGVLRRAPVEDLAAHVARLSAQFEGRLAPKVPWTEKKMSPGVADRMRRMVLPVVMEVTDIDGTWKLNQNKADAVRLAAAERIADGGIGQELADLAALMKDPPAQE